MEVYRGEPAAVFRDENLTSTAGRPARSKETTRMTGKMTAKGSQTAGRRRALGDISNNRHAGAPGKQGATTAKKPVFGGLQGGLVYVDPPKAKPAQQPVVQSRPSVAVVASAKQLASDDEEFDTCNRRPLCASPAFDGGFDLDAALGLGRPRKGSKKTGSGLRRGSGFPFQLELEPAESEQDCPDLSLATQAKAAAGDELDCLLGLGEDDFCAADLDGPAAFDDDADLDVLVEDLEI